MTRENLDPENLTPDDGDGEILVAAEAFAQFDLWIDLQLEKLEARWAPLAAPNASKPRRKIKAAKSA